MENLDILGAVIGGAMIGVAASVLLALNGRIAGISGILGGALTGKGGDRVERITFLGGLVLGAGIVRFAGGEGVHPTAVASLPMLILAGVLVGYGTRLGSGCTSGHGVCGIGRGSKRSLVATAVFMGAGAFTVFVSRHWLGG